MVLVANEKDWFRTQLSILPASALSIRRLQTWQARHYQLLEWQGQLRGQLVAGVPPEAAAGLKDRRAAPYPQAIHFLIAQMLLHFF